VSFEAAFSANDGMLREKTPKLAKPRSAKAIENIAMAAGLCMMGARLAPAKAAPAPAAA
jgi:hypothetical protein